MKRFILFITSLLQIIIVSHASIFHTETFEFSKLNQDTIVINGNQFTLLNYQNLQNTNEIGAPSIPKKHLIFSVPWNASNITINYSTSGLEEIQLQAPIFSVIPTLSEPYEVNFKDSESVQSFDKSAVLVSNNLLYGINRIIGIDVYPVTLYDDHDLKAIFASKVDLTISWNIEDIGFLSESSYKSGANKYFNDIELIVENPEDVIKNAANHPSPNMTDQQDWEYVIIAPNHLCDPLERLAAWRRAKGYGTKIFSVNEALAIGTRKGGDKLSGINDDAGKLRSFLIYANSAYGTRYVLFAGKYPEMPIRYLNISLDTVAPSDYYFTEVNRSWAAHILGATGPKKDSREYDFNISVGRIPFSTKEEIDIYINKLLKYETSYFNNNLHYRENALLTRQYSGMMDYFRNGSSYGYFHDNTITEFMELYNQSCVDLTATTNSPTGKEIIDCMNSTPCGMHFFIGHGHPGAIAISNSYSYLDSNNKRIYMDYGICSLDEENAEMVPESGNGIDCLTNYDYPSWCFSVACSIMPFDTYQNFDYKYNIGESYLFSKGGGIAVFGNTRRSYCVDGQVFNQDFFKLLSSKIYDSGNHNEVLAGDLMLQSRAISSEYRENAIHNLLGDPLSCIYSNHTIVPLRYLKSNGNIHFYGNKDDYPIGLAIQPLNDQTYAYRKEFNHISGDIIDVPSNEIHTIYGKNCLPVILPLTIEDFGFESYIKRYLITGDVVCGTAKDQSSDKGVASFWPGSDVTIESFGNVELRTGTRLMSGSKLTIIAKGNVKVGQIETGDGCKLRIEANAIDCDEEEVYFHPDAIVEFIERNPPLKNKRISKTNNQPKMVVKGRAWWYNLEKSNGTPCDLNSDWHSEFGIQIGDEVEINGSAWHELNVIKRGDGNYYHGMIIEDEYPICISYIREENNNIYALFDYDLLAEYPPLLKVMQTGRWARFISKEPEEVQIYHFGTEGESYLMGSDSEFANCAILSTYKKHFDYDQLECSDTETDHVVANVILNEAGFMEDYSSFTVVEGIGAYDTDKEHMSLFFAPFTDNTAESEFATPVLRFVTPDADLNQTHVIFQAAGGYRQWTQIISAPAVETDSDSQSEFWYGIDGIRVTAPLAPGIYIRVAGGEASKVIVK